MKYTIGIKKSKEGYSVFCPGLPGCWSEGSAEKEALKTLQLRLKHTRLLQPKLPEYCEKRTGFSRQYLRALSQCTSKTVKRAENHMIQDVFRYF